MQKMLCFVLMVGLAPQLCASISSYIPAWRPGGRTMLLVGPGRRAVATELTQQLRAGDSLDILESEPTFFSRLTDQYLNHNGVNVYDDLLEQWDPGVRYDAIIICMPLALLPADAVQAVWHRCQQLARSDRAVFSFTADGIQRGLTWMTRYF